MSEEKKNKKNAAIVINSELHQRLKIQAIKEEKKLYELAEEIFSKYLEK